MLVWHDPHLREGARFIRIRCRDLPRTGGSIVFSPNIIHFRGHCDYKHGGRGSGMVFLGFEFGTQACW
jgi:hypothetical protein